MYTLKTVETINGYIGVDYVKERESYHEIGVDSDVFYINDQSGTFIAKVVSGDLEIYINSKQSAYLVNEQGKTLKVINRVSPNQ